MDKDVLILAIESSCDETAAAVVKNGRDVLSNILRLNCTNYMVASYPKSHQENISKKSIRLSRRHWMRPM